MRKTNKKILEEIIRVDHAGERGAMKAGVKAGVIYLENEGWC